MGLGSSNTSKAIPASQTLMYFHTVSFTHILSPHVSSLPHLPRYYRNALSPISTCPKHSHYVRPNSNALFSKYICSQSPLSQIACLSMGLRFLSQQFSLPTCNPLDLNSSLASSFKTKYRWSEGYKEHCYQAQGPQHQDKHTVSPICLSALSPVTGFCLVSARKSSLCI